MNEGARRSILRMIDASLNRAAEALRVVEDVARFHWNLAGFSSELKALRHALFATACPESAQRRELLLHRDIDGDVGRELASPPTPDGSPEALGFRNLQRAKEALRALEESFKSYRPEVATRLEELRYQLYALEKRLGHLSPRTGLRERLARARIYLLLSTGLTRRPLLEVVAEALAGGADMLQLRAKGLGDNEVLSMGRALRELTLQQGALFIVNDRPDIASLVHADGVHVGQADLPVAAVRAIAGSERLVGVSTHSVEEALVAERQGADYIGVGPMFPTSTKDAGPILGPDGLSRVLASVSLPAFAIGGIEPEKLEVLKAAGAKRVAVSSAVLTHPDPGAAVATLRRALD